MGKQRIKVHQVFAGLFVLSGLAVMIYAFQALRSPEDDIRLKTALWVGIGLILLGTIYASIAEMIIWWRRE